MNQKSKIKVLLYADRKVGNSLVIERVIYNLKQSLKAANIDFTEDIDDEYDIAHFLSARDIIANESTLIKIKHLLFFMVFAITKILKLLL